LFAIFVLFAVSCFHWDCLSSNIYISIYIYIYIYMCVYAYAYAMRVCVCEQEPFRDVLMPAILANDYLRRWSPREGAGAGAGAGAGEPLLDYTSHWPAFLPLYDVSPPVHTCPLGLHMLVWGARGEGGVTARLFDRASSGRLGVSLGQDVPHYLHYATSGFSPALPPAAYSETSLGQGEFLFVPRTMLASFDSGPSADSSVLLRSCFADASNLKDVRAMVALEAQLEPSSRPWLAEIDRRAFDLSLARHPAEPALLSGRGAGAAAAPPGAEAAPEKKGGSRRSRGGGGMRGRLCYAVLYMYRSMR
jgi:hypothetical protein